MNKQDLINKISEKNNFAKKDVKQIIDDFLNIITEQLKNNEKIVLSNFGVFETKIVDSYYRFHPQTGQKIKTKYPKRISFKVSPNMKEYINGENNE